MFDKLALIFNKINDLTEIGADPSPQQKENYMKKYYPSLKPIVKWSGGKTDEIAKFSYHIPDYDLYLEPFVGGGALYFHLNPVKAVISDVHPELICLYQAIAAGNGPKIHEFMKLNANEETAYYKVRNNACINFKEIINSENLEQITEVAQRFYYLRKTCYRGMMRYNKKGEFNIPFGRYKSINFDELLNINYERLLRRTVILNQSFEHLFETYDDPNYFMFLDPPYDSEFTNYGYCEFDRNCHIKLSECFKKTKTKCLMIIGKTDFIVSLYEDYIVAEYEKKYKFKLKEGRVGDEINNLHLIIRNY